MNYDKLVNKTFDFPETSRNSVFMFTNVKKCNNNRWTGLICKKS